VPLVLAIEPDLRQAAIIKRIVREKVLADVAVVDSRDAALEAIRTTVPDVLLISALLSPRDEDELIAHLRTLDDADHLQTHTIPQLASTLGPGEGRAARGLLSAFRRKKEPEAANGCDPDMFADEIRSYLQVAAEKKRERQEGGASSTSQDHAWRKATHAEKVAEPIGEPIVAEAATSSWASPFEWKPSNPSSLISQPYSVLVDPDNPKPAQVDPLVSGAEPLIASPEPLIASPEPLIAYTEPAIVHAEAPTPEPEPVIAAPVTIAEEPRIPVQVDEPVLAAAPVAAPLEEAAAVRVTAPAAAATLVRDPRSGPRDPRSIRDSRLGIRDSRLGVRAKRSENGDRRLGALASWARSENRGPDAVHGGDDLRGLLTSLAVPSAVVAVGYGRGCRIRRVRVPAVREPKDAEAVGPVILSKRALAERRERREQSPA
jgi:hypothetical protein